jgi:ADP-heptose:LPS heptosyltransferase
MTLVVSGKVLPLALECPFVNTVIGLPTSAGRALPPLQKIFKWLRQVLPLRDKFSSVVQLYRIASPLGALWMRLLLTWIDAEITIGRNLSGRKPLYTRSISDAPAPQYQVEDFLQVASLLNPHDQEIAERNTAGFTEDDCKLELWISDQVLIEIRDWLQAMASRWEGLSGPLVSVALGGDRASRHESPERAEQWLLAIQEQWQARPILIGTPDDPSLPAQSPIKHIDTRGAFSILQSTALIACADFVITTHSSAQHIAGALQKPTVVLVGPGDPKVYHPQLPAEKMRLLQHTVPCSPCYHHKCPLPQSDYKRCLYGIAPEAVVSAFREILESPGIP